MNAFAPIVASVQRRPSRAIVIAVPLVAALLGAVLAWAVRGDDHSTPEPASSTGQAIVTAGDLRLTLPDGWKRTSHGQAVPGLPAGGTTYISSLSTDVALAVLPPASPSLLPTELATARGASAPGPRPVKLGPVRAYHYVIALGGQRVVDVFVAPTTSGTATVACSTTVYELGECQTVVGALKLARGSFLPLSANAAFLERLPTTIATLNAQRDVLRKNLAAATTPVAGATAANHLASAYAKASAALRPLLPPTGDARATVRLLDSLRAEHASLADALAVRDSAGFTRIAATVKRHEQELASQLTAWQRSLPS